MTNWPSAGTVRDVDTERNLRILRKRGGEILNEARELFPQFVTPGAKKINFGSIQVEWPGGAIESKTTEVTHGLGATPAVVLLTPVFVTATRRMFPQIVSTSSTKIGLNSACADAVPAAGTKQTIHWQAIG